MTFDEITIVDLGQAADAVREQAAVLLWKTFSNEFGWPTLEAARAEVRDVLDEGFARAAMERDLLLGWIGALPEYRGRVWELHPLVVRAERRRRGIGRALVGVFEDEARRRGAITATLGTDDDSGRTSLSGIDLYLDLPRRLAEVRDLGSEHPFLFYERLGYRITGVLPDANGPGRPDIFMSKRL